MPQTTTDSWNSHCLDAPLFEPLSLLAPELKKWPTHWPSLDSYQHLLNTHKKTVQTKNKKTIRFVEQGDKPSCFEEQYENRIYLTGEVQTRLKNWHDFFQVLVWRTFPQIKVELNARHYQAAVERKHNASASNNRSPIENAITLFDECGAIVLSSDAQLLELIKQHKWKELFWHRRSYLDQHFKCVVFGHALYEKAITPYIGMTAHCALITVPENMLVQPLPALLEYCDHHVAQSFTHQEQGIQSPKDLQPLPILGMPGWHPENNQERFYNNQHYFRPKRK